MYTDLLRFTLVGLFECWSVQHVASSRLIRVADSDPIRRAGTSLDVRAANIFGGIARLREVLACHDDKRHSITRETRVAIITW